MDTLLIQLIKEESNKENYLYSASLAFIGAIFSNPHSPEETKQYVAEYLRDISVSLQECIEYDISRS